MQSPGILSPQQLDAIALRVRDGDAHAFEQLFRATHPALVQFATRYAGDHARAEELVQDVFFSIWQAGTQWTPQGSVRAYLFRAVRNRALNLVRRDAIEKDWETHIGHADEHAPATDSIVAELAHEELVTRAHIAIDSLPERCRLVMHLRWREQMSYAEIAEVMGIGVKGVENQLARGLRAVRGKLLGD
ncbi:MAG: RNA polymerase sigma-70 factor [Gemmatimonas sp.]